MSEYFFNLFKVPFIGLRFFTIYGDWGRPDMFILKILVGNDKKKRTMLAGIKAAYKVEDLVGRSVVVAANLAPRKMKFGTSEGMILAAGPGGDQIFLLSTDEGAKPGMKIK